MHHSYTEINLDKSVLVRFKAVYKNSLNLYFKFLDANNQPVDVTGTEFRFVITDANKTTEYLVVENIEWTRDETNEIKHVTNELDLLPDTYKVDFTCIYADGRIQTLMDGEFVVRERFIVS